MPRKQRHVNLLNRLESSMLILLIPALLVSFIPVSGVFLLML